MTSRPHLAFGLFSGAICTSLYQLKNSDFIHSPINLVLALAAALIGSLFPDIDTPGSPFGKLPFVAELIQKHTVHRGFLHTPMGAGIAALGVYVVVGGLADLLTLPPDVPGILGFFFLGGMIGHLGCDTLTRRGIFWLWPWKRAIVYHTAPRYRIKTGDKKAERQYIIFFLLLFFACIPIVIMGGPVRSIHKTFQDFQMAKTDYRSTEAQETMLEFTGTFRHSRAPANGKGLILDIHGDGFVVYRNGQILTVGEEAIVLATTFVVEYSDDVPQVVELPFFHEPFDSILAQIPDNVLISGELVAHQTFQATAPLYTVQDFPAIILTANRIQLTYASRSDMASLNINVRVPDAVRKKQKEILAMQEDIKSVETELEAVADEFVGLNVQQDLVGRHQLRQKMAELKARRKNLKTILESGQRNIALSDKTDLAFSGKLMLRKLPEWIESK